MWSHDRSQKTIYCGSWLSKERGNDYIDVAIPGDGNDKSMWSKNKKRLRNTTC